MTKFQYKFKQLEKTITQVDVEMRIIIQLEIDRICEKLNVRFETEYVHWTITGQYGGVGDEHDIWPPGTDFDKCLDQIRQINKEFKEVIEFASKYGIPLWMLTSQYKSVEWKHVSKIKKCEITRYDPTIENPPFLTLHLENVQIVDPEIDYLGEERRTRLECACRSKGYRMKFWSLSQKKEYDYEIVVY